MYGFKFQIFKFIECTVKYSIEMSYKVAITVLKVFSLSGTEIRQYIIFQWKIEKSGKFKPDRCKVCQKVKG